MFNREVWKMIAIFLAIFGVVVYLMTAFHIQPPGPATPGIPDNFDF